MKKAAKQIAVMFVLLLIVCLIGRVASGNTYTAYIPLFGQNGQPPQTDRLRIEAAEPEGVTLGEPKPMGVSEDAPWMEYVRVTIRPNRPGGSADISLRDEAGNELHSAYFRVGRLMTVYDMQTGGFTGDNWVLAAFTAFCLSVAWIMFRLFRRLRGPEFYSYVTIYAAGLSLFSFLTGLVMLYATLNHWLRPQEYFMMSAYTTISGASYRFLLLTSPAMLAFSVAMAVSNIALLRHERFRPQNVLGLAISALLVLGMLLAGWLYARDFMGSEWEWRVVSAFHNVYATVYAYFECMLASAVICGLMAAKHVPAPDADYILILGCRFRRDGTLTPLLRGRADRAIALWRQQQAAGKQAVLIPSGGQGDDEVMPEAEAIRRYLLEQGVPDSAILPEDRSRNTYQNMQYSKQLIDARGGGKTVYATTNYHVFRSGVWASLAGLPAEGVGSRTKWWYWPNAFMRECAGLFRNRIKEELLLLIVLIAFFTALTLALG